MAARDKTLALQPSSAKRWLRCTASPLLIIRMADKIPEDTSSSYSREGTEAHDHGATALLLGDTSSIPAELQETVGGYATSILERLNPSTQLVVEEKVPLWYMLDRNGQIDARLYELDADLAVTRLEFDDYKHGAGVKVDAEENEQLLIYARSVIEDMRSLFYVPDSLPVKMRIYQPRARNADGSAVSEWALTVSEIVSRSNPIEVTATLIRAAASGDKDAENQLAFAPDDDTCQFCPIKKLGCPARQAMIPAPVSDFLNLDTAPATLDSATLTAEQVSAIVLHGKAAIKFIQDVQAGALEAMLADPSSVPGVKLVAYKGGHRKWTSEEEAATLLFPKFTKGACVNEAPLKSPAQIDKVIKDSGLELSTRFLNRLKELTTKDEGKPTLAPLDDPRPALTGGASDFTDLNNEAE